MSPLTKHIEEIVEENFYQDFNEFWVKESRHCDQTYLTADTKGIIKDFLRTKLSSLVEVECKALSDKLRAGLPNLLQEYGAWLTNNPDAEPLERRATKDGLSLKFLEQVLRLKEKSE